MSHGKRVCSVSTNTGLELNGDSRNIVDDEEGSELIV